MKPIVAIVGASGAVGREMLAVLEQRAFPIGELRLLGSARSAGQRVPALGRSAVIAELGERSLDGVDIVLFSAGSAVSRRFAPAAVARGTVVVDNSSAFRMEAGVPLIVPEINGDRLPRLGAGQGCLLPVGNCTAIILTMGLTPLKRMFGIDRIVAATYQAASGAGAQAMEELRSQTREVLEGRAAMPRIFHEPYAFNLFSHNAPVDPVSGLNGEEAKVIEEARKIWEDPSVRISVTCVRVPVMRAHTETANVTLSRPATLEQVRRAFEGFPGVRVIDDRAGNLFPTPLKASGGDDVLVGRLREDPSQVAPGWRPGEPTRGFDLLIAGDQLRKGAALTAVQIAEKVLEGRG